MLYVLAVDISKMEPRQIVRSGTFAINKFVDHWIDNMPDVSEKPVIPPTATQFWMMDDKGVINTKKRHPKPHSRLAGLRGQHLNGAIDSSIAECRVPLVFKDDNKTSINLVPECMVRVWLDYIVMLKGHPSPESNSCQLVLKYMMINEHEFVKAYHDRMYYFSSGTKFAEVSDPLTKWMKYQDLRRQQHLQDGGETKDAPPSSKNCVKRLLPEPGLYETLGDTMINFMRVKPQPFGVKATRSQEDFWNVPAYKRCLTFMYLARYILGLKSQKNWKKFKQEDYKFNRRCFKRWEEKEDVIMVESKLYKKMVDRIETATPKKRMPSDNDTFSSDSPMKRRFVVADESTSDSE